MKTTKTFIVILLTMYSSTYCQDQNFNQEINNSIWKSFTKAFETYDAELFSTLHSNEFIRISGDSKTIKNVENYINGYRKRWENKNIKQTIDFRFTERINNGTLASEKGIYKLTVNLDEPNESSYYGAFHVVIRKERNNWKLLVDYDFNPKNSINENDFLNANPK